MPVPPAPKAIPAGRWRKQTVTNIDGRLKGTIRDANGRLVEQGIDPISDRVAPRSLRRTYASIRAAAGDHPVYIAEQLGHEDRGFTFRVYQRAAKRRDRLSTAYREAYDRALDWAAMASGAGFPTRGDPIEHPAAAAGIRIGKPKNCHPGPVAQLVRAADS